MTDESWLDTPMRRAPIVRIFETGQTMVLVHADGDGRELHGDSAALARAVLELLVVPRTGRELLAALQAATGAAIERPAVIGELLGVLREAGAIEHGARPSARRRAGPGPRVVLGLTGAVATMHAPAMVQRLQERGFRVRVAATDSAARFVQLPALEALTHEPVVAGLWPIDERSRVPHIELAQWADAVVVCPASATTIARLATGDHGSIVSAIALATRAPVLVVPSMNEAMLDSAAVRRNLETLVADGLHVAAPAAGVEIADRPQARTLALGAAPPPSAVVPLIEAMLRRRGARSRRFPDAEDWDAMYRDHLPEGLPWHVETADEDLLATVARLASAPASVLEIGTGLGTLAIELALRGHRVVATDVSTEALDRAQARAGADVGHVVWLRDDITHSALRGRFELVIDRGCLHGLSEAGSRAYAAAVVRLLAPGGALVLKTLVPELAPQRQVAAHTAKTLAALFEGRLALEVDEPSTMPGPDEAVPARSFVLRRVASG